MESKIVLGDCLNKLKDIDSNSIDLIVTDPPYGFSFMGKHWDKAIPSIDIWKECFRVLKPGAFAFVMSSPRTDVQYRMGKTLEDAGFITSLHQYIGHIQVDFLKLIIWDNRQKKNLQ